MFHNLSVEIDLQAAVSFIATHGRLLDRRRLHLLLGDGDPLAVLTALDAYRNPDGGYGWGLEPDLRSAESQPAAAMHALEVLCDAAPATTPRAVELCDWLQSHTLGDGGLPFALPIGDPAGCSPWWALADPSTSSLQMTAQVAANAHLVGRHDSSVADHPWLTVATAYCVEAIRGIDAAPHALELRFALQFLDAAAQSLPASSVLLKRLGRFVPADGSMHVEGGADDETLHPLDFSPQPGTPSRDLFAPELITNDLGRLARLQQPDGGWPVDFASASPIAALEWRGYATVRAVTLLQVNAG